MASGYSAAPGGRQKSYNRLLMARVLYVATSTTIGGAEKTVFTLATLMDPKTFPVAGVVSLKPKGHYAQKLEDEGIKTWTLGVKGNAGLKDLQRLALVIHQAKPDLVHAVMYQAIQLCRAVRRLGYAEYKLVSSPRVNYRTRSGFSLWVDKKLRGSDDLLVAECESSRRHLIDRLKYPEAKVSTIYNGVDIAGWPVSKSERKRHRAKAQIPDESVLIGAVGRLDEQKGHVFLLEAVAKLKPIHPVKCLIIGTGPLKGHLEETAKRLRIHEDVRFMGEQDDIPGWLSAMDVFVQPSLWEGMPNAMLEAMALGLPVVATRVDGIPEAVAHEISGLLCAPKDSQALFVHIQDLIVEKDLRAKLGEAARQVIVNSFQFTSMIPKYEEAYARALGSGPEKP